MEKTVDLSIIIVSYNTKDLTLKCLSSLFQSLKSTDLHYEVIVVDNASSDGSQIKIRESFPKVRLHQNKENVGFGKANNQGVKWAKGKVILLLNSDTEVLDKAIEKLYKYFLTIPESSVVGGKLFNPDLTPQPSCGPAYTLPMIFMALFLKGDYTGVTRYSPNTVKEIDWVMGACMMFSRQLFLDSGGFDEGIFMYMEEIDWQHRLKLDGSNIYFFPEAHFIHIGAGSNKETSKYPILNVYRGFLYFYNKHYSKIHLSILRILLLLKSCLVILIFTLTNNKSDRNIYFKALKLAAK